MKARGRIGPLAAAVAIAVIFVALNHRAYDGFFQDDELDNLMWAPHVSAARFVTAFVSPLFAENNFRPVGHLYFAVMGKLFGEDFPPYMTPIFALHLLNGALIFALVRRLGVGAWHALAGVAFFVLSAGAFDAYWKPMYCFDLFCTAFSLGSILLYSRRRWVLSFVAFWCAYKSKELAVMLPAVLLAWEWWFGERQYRRLIPFVLVSLSFGLQGLWRNPNVENAYAFRFTWDALLVTVPFYAARFFLLPGSGVVLVLLMAIRDRRVWFGMMAAGCFLLLLLFLPGRLFEAYAYLPLACLSVALAAAASRVGPVWMWTALFLWMPWNMHDLREEQRATLAADDKAFVFVDNLNRWVVEHPSITTLVYDRPPGDYHDWGVVAAWNLAHRQVKMPAYFAGSAEARDATANERVAYAAWEGDAGRLILTVRGPLPKK